MCSGCRPCDKQNAFSYFLSTGHLTFPTTPRRGRWERERGGGEGGGGGGGRGGGGEEVEEEEEEDALSEAQRLIDVATAQVHRTCSLTIEYVLLPYNVCSCYNV